MHFTTFCNRFNKFNNAGALLSDSIYNMTLKLFKIKNASMVRNRYKQVPYLTQDTTWECYKNTIKHHKQEPRGQPFPSR